MKKIYLPVFLTLFTSAAFAQVYVTPTGAGTKDGSSWANAFDGTQLQQAINVSVGGGQVWVAKGTYKPTESLSANGLLSDGVIAATIRDNAFILKAGVEIYGGFSGTEAFGAAALAARNFAMNETILSGDLNNTDAADDGDSYHVVATRNASVGTILDGFTVQHGFANGAASVTVGGDEIKQNLGAGIYVKGDQDGTLFKNLLVKSNKSTINSAGMYLIGPAGSVTIDKSIFKDNSSSTGAHIYILNGKATIKNTTFENGLATGNGGAIFMASGADLLDISLSKFYGNTANGSTGGGAIYAGSNLNISKSDFRDNTAAASGGAIYSNTPGAADANVNLSNSYFYNNISNRTGTTLVGGGAIFSTFSGTNRTNVTAINNTFYANQSPNSPHGAIAYNGDLQTSLTLYNNIFNGNTASGGASADIRKRGDAVLDFQNNLFQIAIVDGVDGNDTFTANIVNDAPSPLFQSTTASDYNFLYPTSNSVVNEKGNNALYATVGNINTDTHLAGYARLAGPIIDMGAVEYASVLPVTVKSFTAKLANNRTQLNWTVGTEDNVRGYVIERSQNGVDFDKVAELKASKANTYTTVDAAPQVGLNYYRLKTIDNDGTSSLYGSLQTVKVEALTAQGVKIYPNPVQDGNVNVMMTGYPAGSYSYKLVNTAGKVVQQGQVNFDGVNAVTFTTNASAGLYVLSLANGNVKVQTKLIKK